VPPIAVIWDAQRRARHDATRLGLTAPPNPLSIPWWPIIGTAVLVPLAAMVIAGLMTRARPL
jgi:hypothetical protein